MPDAIRITKLDFQTIKPYATAKTLFAMLFVLAIFAFLTDSGAMGICMLMAMCSFYVSYPFAVGEQNGIDTLYATLPVARSRVVTGRYLFAFCTTLLSGVVAYGLLGVITMLRGLAFDWAQNGVVTIAAFVVFTLIQAIQVPLFFRYGYARSKMLAYLPFAGIPVIVLLGSELLKNETYHQFALRAMDLAAANPAVSIAAGVALWLVLMALSLTISQHVYSKRDF